MKSTFYTHGDTGTYDATIDLVVPLYALFHDTLAALVECSEPDPARAFTVLDIGAGSGTEALGVLRRFPLAKVVALDASETMRVKFLENLVRLPGAGAEAEQRCHWITGDFLADSIVERVRTEAQTPRGGFDVVISGFTLHHFTTSGKRLAYSRAFELLAPGGCLINLDLFTFSSAAIASHAKAFDKFWISTQFRSPDPRLLAGITIPAIAEAQSISQEHREQLRTKWLAHHEKDNLLESIEGQQMFLRDIGFVDCECPMRFWNTGLLYARKPKQKTTQ